MAKLPWWPFYGSAFFGDERVKLMSNAQIGMYAKLLDHQWNEGSVPLNIGFSAFMDLRNRLHDPAVAEKEFAEVMAQCFVPHPTIPSRVYNIKMDQVRREQVQIHKDKQQAGRRGGRATQAKQRSSTASSSPSISAQQNQNQNQNQNKTQSQKESQKEIQKPHKNGQCRWRDCAQEFWTFFPSNPRKVGKGSVEKWFKTHQPSPELMKTILDQVLAMSKTDQWKKHGGQFIPAPMTWLHQERWNDEVPTAVSVQPKSMVDLL